MHGQRPQTGSSLLEVMIAVLITAVGLLGLAALQNTSLKLSYDSFLRSQASFIAYDLIDRIRANPDAAPYELGAGDTLTEPTSCNYYYQNDTDAGCDLSKVRSYDLYTWKKQVSEVLPGAIPIVAFDAITQRYALTLKWNDRNDLDGTTPESKQFVYHFQIN